MKKSLIAFAVAGAFTAQAAMADATIYGAANISFDAVNNGVVAAISPSTTNNHISSNVSKIGFKGTEDLGSGLSALWQIETQVNLDNNTTGTTLGGRNTFVGLSSDTMGSLIAGRADTPYKSATRGLDMFGDTVADNRSIMGLGGAFDARVTNVAQYTSPEMSGFKVAIATVAGAETATNGNTKGGTWSLAGMYNAGPINASLSYQVVDVGTAGTGDMGAGATTGGINLTGYTVNDKIKAWKLGGSYTMDAMQFNAIYEKSSGSGSVNATNVARTALYLAGKFNVSATDAVKAAYTSAGKFNNIINTESTQFSLGYDHSLSKRTTVYALYSKITNKANASATFSQSTSSGNPAAGSLSATDADPSVFSLGMKHAF